MFPSLVNNAGKSVLSLKTEILKHVIMCTDTYFLWYVINSVAHIKYYLRSQMLPRKSTKNNTLRILWKILFQKRTDKGGCHKNSGPHQIATHLEQVIFPLSLRPHHCCELHYDLVQLEHSATKLFSCLLSWRILSFTWANNEAFSDLCISVFRHKHLGPIDLRIYKRYACKYHRIFTNTASQVCLFSQTVELLYSHCSYFRSCSYLLL